MAELRYQTRLLFIAMWNFADDGGYLRHDCKWLKAKCLPYDKVDISDLINELVGAERIEIQNEIIFIKNFLKHQRIDKPQESDLKTKFQERSKNGSECSGTKIEVKLREVEVKNDSAEPQSVSTPPEAPPVMLFPVCGNGKEEWPLTQELFEQLKASYPAVQILEQCRSARAWCVTNPTRRKTARGMPAFLNRWLAKEQNRGGSIGTGSQNNRKHFEEIKDKRVAGIEWKK